MTPLPRGAVGKWMGWGRGVSALELARWVGDGPPTKSFQGNLYFPRHHSLNQGTPAPTRRGWV